MSGHSPPSSRTHLSEALVAFAVTPTSNLTGINATLLHDAQVKFTATHAVLASLYLIPVALCLHWRVKPILVTGIYSFWQVCFSLMMLLGCLSRVAFWVYQPFLFDGLNYIRSDLNVYWNFIPSMFFFSCYLVILFLWIEIYHSGGDVKTKPIYAVVSVFMYAGCFAFFIVDYLMHGQSPPRQYVPLPTNKVQELMFLYDGCLYVAASLGFLVYGGLFYLKFAGDGRQPLLQKMRLNVLPRVKLLTLLCGIMFTARAVITMVADVKHRGTAGMYWWLDLAYYGSLEVTPLILMLLIFRHSAEAPTAPLNSLLTEQ